MTKAGERRRASFSASSSRWRPMNMDNIVIQITVIYITVNEITISSETQLLVDRSGTPGIPLPWDEWLKTALPVLRPDLDPESRRRCPIRRSGVQCIDHAEVSSTAS